MGFAGAAGACARGLEEGHEDEAVGSATRVMARLARRCARDSQLRRIGRRPRWGGQARNDEDTSKSPCVRRYGAGSVPARSG